MAAKLKVFTWSDGFHAFTVATPSRPKALEAWGSKQDLFATGLARPLTGGPDYDAALAAPGEVVARGLAIDVGKIGKVKRVKTRGPSKAKAARIEKLEAALADLDQRHQAAPPARSPHGAAVEQKQPPGARSHHEHEDRERQGEGVRFRLAEPLSPDEDHPRPVDARLLKPQRRPQSRMIAIEPGEGLGGRLQRDEEGCGKTGETPLWHEQPPFEDHRPFEGGRRLRRHSGGDPARRAFSRRI